MLYGSGIFADGTFCCTVERKWILLNFYIGPTKFACPLLCQESMFTPLFDLLHFRYIPTSCTWCFTVYHGEKGQCCGAASGYMYASSVFLCKQLPMTLAWGEFSMQAGNLSPPFLLHMALSLLMITLKTIWCQQLTFRAAQ